MKIIDLLNKIANGEEVPKKIKIYSLLWEYNPSAETYYTNKTDENLFEYCILDKSILNRELEIIEDNKIGKINRSDILDKEDYMLSNCIYLMNKINEIIDKLNELSDE